MDEPASIYITPSSDQLWPRIRSFATISFPLQSGVDHGLPCSCPCVALVHTNTPQHLLRRLPHRRYGSVGHTRTTFTATKWPIRSAPFIVQRLRHALDH